MLKFELLGQILNVLAIDEEARLYSVIRLQLPGMENIDLKCHHIKFIDIDQAILSYSEVIPEDEALRLVKHLYENVVMGHTDHQKSVLRHILEGHYVHSTDLHVELETAGSNRRSFWKRWWRQD